MRHAERSEEALLREGQDVLAGRLLDDAVERLLGRVVVGPDLAGRRALAQADREARAVGCAEQLHVVGEDAPLASRVHAQQVAHRHGLAALPRHCGIQVEALCPMRRSPSSWAIPTSVLATDLVAE